jgi:hypothetical protein
MMYFVCRVLVLSIIIRFVFPAIAVATSKIRSSGFIRLLIYEKTKISGRSYYRSSDSDSWEYGNDVDSKHTKLDEKADKSGRPYFRGSDSDSWEYEYQF